MLTSRSPFPAKETWTEWATSDNSNNRIGRKIDQLQKLEALGAEIWVRQADVSDSAQMEALFAEIETKLGTLHGVIYAAGISDGEFFDPIDELSVTQCEAHFRAKADGLYSLERGLAGKHLDFCVCFSALSSILGGLEHGGYVAANNFIDLFIRAHNRRSSQSWLSINWDMWQTDPAMSDSRGVAKFAMSAAEAIQAFERVLANELTGQIVNSTGNLEARIDQWVRMISTNEVDDHAEQANTAYPRPHLETSYVAPTTENEKRLAEIWQIFLGIEEVGVDDNFFELGGDSLLSLRVIGKAKQAGLHFTFQQFFQHQTIRELLAVEGTALVEVSQESVVGSFPLKRGQAEEVFTNPQPHWWNMESGYQVFQSLDMDVLQQVVRYLQTHHDALRLHIVPQAAGWQQFIPAVDKETAVPFTYIDLSTVPENEFEAELRKAVTRVRQSLDLFEGPLMRMAFFDKSGSGTGYILMIMHRLIVDTTSLKILLEDFSTIYQQLILGKSVKLPLKTTSYKDWVENYNAYYDELAAHPQLESWLKTPLVRNIPPR